MAEKTNKQQEIDEQIPFWRERVDDLIVRNKLILFTSNHISLKDNRSLILELINMGIYDYHLLLYRTTYQFIFKVICSQDIQLIDACIKRKLVNPIDEISIVARRNKYISFSFLLNFLTLKEINDRYHFCNRNLIELSISEGLPKNVALLIEKGANVFNLKILWKEGYFQKECLLLIQKRQEEIILNLLNQYLIDDLSNLVTSFFDYLSNIVIYSVFD